VLQGAGVWRIKLAFVAAGILGLVPALAGPVSLATLVALVVFVAIVLAPTAIDRWRASPRELWSGVIRLLGVMALIVALFFSVFIAPSLIFGIMMIWGPFFVYGGALRTRVGSIATGVVLLGIAAWTYLYVDHRFDIGSSTAPIGFLYLPFYGWPLVGFAVLLERLWIWGDKDPVRPSSPPPRPPSGQKKGWRVVGTGNYVGLSKTPPEHGGEEDEATPSRTTPEEI
jgi:hypothetical protein